jgi:hypothetical protein
MPEISRFFGISIMVVEWAAEHREELVDLWGRAASKEPLYKVEPLK